MTRRETGPPKPSTTTVIPDLIRDPVTGSANIILNAPPIIPPPHPLPPFVILGLDPRIHAPNSEPAENTPKNKTAAPHTPRHGNV